MTDPPRRAIPAMMCWTSGTRRPGMRSPASVIDDRLAVSREPRFFTAGEWAAADALCRRILPQPANRHRCRWWRCWTPSCSPITADGFREGDMPYMREAWRKALPRSRRRRGRGMTGAPSPN